MSLFRRLSAACATVLVASGLVVAPFLTGPAAAAELIQDGSFEAAAGNPPNSASWNEWDSERGTPICSTPLCPNSASISPPRTGDKWVVFGARNVANHSAGLNQNVTIPPGNATLTYWYRSAEVNSPFDAVVTVKMDGTTLRSHTETSTPQSGYSQQTINISQYANGANHVLTFEYWNGNNTSLQRMVIDDVSINHTPTVVTGTPTVTSTTPGSPSNSTTPLVKGTAESGSTVTLYSNNTCSSSSLGSGSASSFAGSGITATVPANATTTIWARATKSGQTASACSSTSVGYTNDSSAPGQPTLTGVTPSSPNTSTNPVVKGTAEAGSTVKLYGTAGCTGSPAATGTAAAFASSGLTATVVLGSTTTFRATATDAAGNTSGCSTSSVSYKSDLRDGGFESTTGDPALSPDWTEADSLAVGGTPLCTVATCTPGAEIAPHAGNAWVWFGGFAEAGHTGSVSQSVVIPVGSVALNYWYRNSSVTAPFDAVLMVQVDGTTVKTHTEAAVAESAYTKQVVDLSSFANGASHLLSFSYVNGGAGVTNMLLDDVGLTPGTAPHTAMPTVTGTVPASPSTSTTPKVKGTAEAGSSVRLYSNSTCTSAVLGTGSATEFAAAGVTATVAAAATTTKIYAKAVKAGQNDSPCSTTFASYVHLGAPETTLVKTPKKKVPSRKRKHKVAFTFSSPAAGATFECSIDGKKFRACTSGHRFKLKIGRHKFAVRAVAGGLTDPTPATYRFRIKRKH